MAVEDLQTSQVTNGFGSDLHHATNWSGYIIRRRSPKSFIAQKECGKNHQTADHDDDWPRPQSCNHHRIGS